MELKDVPNEISSVFSNEEFKTWFFKTVDSLVDIPRVLKDNFQVKDSPKKLLTDLLRFISNMTSETKNSYFVNLSGLENLVYKTKFLAKLSPLPARLVFLSLRFLLESSVERGITAFQDILNDDYISNMSGVVYKIIILNITTNSAEWKRSSVTTPPKFVTWSDSFSAFTSHSDFEKYCLYFEKNF